MKVKDLRKLLSRVDGQTEVVFEADSIQGGTYHAPIAGIAKGKSHNTGCAVVVLKPKGAS